MKIVLHTIYENVDEQFVDFYIKSLKAAQIPIDFEDFKEGHLVIFQSSDPAASEMIATTEYRIIR